MLTRWSRAVTSQPNSWHIFQSNRPSSRRCFSSLRRYGQPLRRFHLPISDQDFRASSLITHPADRSRLLPRRALRWFGLLPPPGRFCRLPAWPFGPYAASEPRGAAQLNRLQAHNHLEWEPTVTEFGAFQALTIPSNIAAIPPSSRDQPSFQFFLPQYFDCDKVNKCCTESIGTSPQPRKSIW
jgi:hypothetical protein